MMRLRDGIKMMRDGDIPFVHSKDESVDIHLIQFNLINKTEMCLTKMQ